MLKKARVERTVNTIPNIKIAAKEENESESDSDGQDGSAIEIDQEKLKQDEWGCDCLEAIPFWNHGIESAGIVPVLGSFQHFVWLIDQIA